MKYRVAHTTTYTYADMVTLCQNEIHLAPRSCVQQTCLRSMLKIVPTPAVLSERKDYFGNVTALFAVQERHDKLEVHALSEVEVRATSVPAAQLTPSWEDVRDGFYGEQSLRHLDANQFLHESPYIQYNKELARYAMTSFTPGRPVLEGALELTQRVFKDFVYDSKATTATTPVMEVFALRRGVCQDFAHLEIACLRSIGLAARYVSGYLLTVPPPGKERLIGADASHAWLSLYCPGFGWIDLDPTNNIIPSDKHVTVAWGRDYTDVCPIKGVILGGGSHSIDVAVDVIPI